jgi:hypothetical protein
MCIMMKYMRSLLDYYQEGRECYHAHNIPLFFIPVRNPRPKIRQKCKSRLERSHAVLINKKFSTCQLCSMQEKPSVFITGEGINSKENASKKISLRSAMPSRFHSRSQNVRETFHTPKHQPVRNSKSCRCVLIRTFAPLSKTQQKPR